MPGYWTEWGVRPVLHPQEVQRYSLPNLTEDNDNTLCQFARPRAKCSFRCVTKSETEGKNVKRCLFVRENSWFGSEIEVLFGVTV